jgi:hypothetical protein
MKLTGENRSTRGKTCPSATLSTTNPAWTDVGSHGHHMLCIRMRFSIYDAVNILLNASKPKTTCDLYVT